MLVILGHILGKENDVYNPPFIIGRYCDCHI
jgi:hypothetical protein